MAFNLRPARQRNWQLLHNGEPLPKETKARAKETREVLQEQYEVERIITTKTCPSEVC